MAEKKTPKSKGGAPEESAPEETENLYTLPELAARLGAATEDEVGAYIEGLSKADLIEEGADVVTRRIDKDAARIYGIAADFFDKATEAQLDMLVGVSKDMLRVAAWAALQGSARAEARQKAGTKAGASRQARVDEAELVRTSALARRKSLRAGLRSLAAGNQVLRGSIDAAYGSQATSKSLADALAALAQLGRAMLKKPGPTMKARLANARLTPALLEATEQLAEKVRATGGAAEAVLTAAPIAQADVDYWDGINLFLLGTIIEVFEAGHELDRTIPRLVPIALRSYFSPKRRRAQPEETEKTGVSEPA